MTVLIYYDLIGDLMGDQIGDQNSTVTKMSIKLSIRSSRKIWSSVGLVSFLAALIFAPMMATPFKITSASRWLKLSETVDGFTFFLGRAIEVALISPRRRSTRATIEAK